MRTCDLSPEQRTDALANGLVSRIEQTVARARALAERGYRVFPVDGNKRPYFKGWKDRATRDPDEVASLFAGYAPCNIAIVTDGLLVIDIDRREDGDGFAHLDRLREAAGAAWDAAPVVQTPSGGAHHYFRLRAEDAERWEVRSRAHVLGPASRVDVKTGAGSYIVAPGSGRGDRCYRGTLPGLGDLPFAPKGLLRLLYEGAERSGKGRKRKEPDLPTLLEEAKAIGALDVADHEDWQTGLFAIASAVRKGVLEREEGWRLLENWSRTLPNGTLCPTHDAAGNRRRFDHAVDHPPKNGKPITAKSIARRITQHRSRQAWGEARPGDAVDRLIAQGDGPVDPETAFEALNRDWAFIERYGGRAAVWSERDEDVVRLDDFHHRTAPLKVTVLTRGKARVTAASRLWAASSSRRVVNRVVFDPTRPAEFEEKGCTILNSYRGLAVERVAMEADPEATARPILDHFRERICRGDPATFDELMRLVAWWRQNLDKPGQVAIVLQGGQGTGKSLAARAICSVYEPYTLRTGDRGKIVGRFNSALETVLCLQADEAFFAGNPTIHRRLKALITDERTTYERKCFDAGTGANRVRLVMTTNESWAVPAEADDRRFFVLRVADREPGDAAYFRALARAIDDPRVIAAFDRILTGFVLGDWHPAQMNLGTAAHLEQKIESLELVPRLIHGWLVDGEIPASIPGEYAEGPIVSFADWSRGEVRLENREADRIVWLAQRRAREEHTRQRLPDKGAITKSLRRVIGMKTGKSGSRRYWLLPPLDEARAAFERWIGGAIDWDEADTIARPRFSIAPAS